MCDSVFGKECLETSLCFHSCRQISRPTIFQLKQNIGLSDKPSCTPTIHSYTLLYAKNDKYQKLRIALHPLNMVNHSIRHINVYKYTI